MAIQKKFVIKINRPKIVPEISLNKVNQQAKLITEWNIKRIFTAGLLLILLILGIIYFLVFKSNLDDIFSNNQKSAASGKDYSWQGVIANNSDITDPTDTTEGTINQIATLKTVHEDNIKNIKKIDKSSLSAEDKETRSTAVVHDVQQTELIHYDGLVRVQLARAINNKEPVGTISLPVKVNKENAKGVFFFTELKGKKGQVIYHEWLYKGKIIYKRRINVLGNRWRAATRKMMNYRIIGPWSVRLTDHEGKVLHEIKFAVVN